MKRNPDELTAAELLVVDVENGVVTINESPVIEITLTMENLKQIVELYKIY